LKDTIEKNKKTYKKNNTNLKFKRMRIDTKISQTKETILKSSMPCTDFDGAKKKKKYKKKIYPL
jgi:site-specific DNA-cytosine methylase